LNTGAQPIFAAFNSVSSSNRGTRRALLGQPPVKLAASAPN
jgi:hypothetical protein